MAAKDKETKIVLERTYNIPLRRKFQLAPSYKRTNRAVKAVKEYLQKHMKSETVKIGYYLNNKLWENGIRNPPHHIKVNAIKDEKGIVRTEIVGKEIQLEQEKPEKKEETITDKLGLKKGEEEAKQETYTPKGEAAESSSDKASATEKADEKKSSEKPVEEEKETTENKNEEAKVASKDSESEKESEKE
ncbi:MAG: 50S ribosomal protein L31e, partial [Nanobdellota archaeon]